MSGSEVGVALNISRMLRQPPSSYDRVRLGRRFSFGYPSLMRRKRRDKSRVKQRRSRRPSSTPQSQSQSTCLDDQLIVAFTKPQSQSQSTCLDDQLIVAFTNHAGLDPSNRHREARARLRHLLTYGGIGLLPKEHWPYLVDQRLTNIIDMFKLGRVDGTINWPVLMERLRVYALRLNLVAPSPQLAQAIFNMLPKPPRWHGGEGEAVTSVRQRATLTLNAPQLHSTWIVIPVQSRLKLSLFDPQTFRHISETCHVLFIFDQASERPMGCWISSDKPHGTELRLALYQAIWHPHTTEWYLRGIPEKIQVPSALLADGHADLTRAVWWMMSSLRPLSQQEERHLKQRMPIASEIIQRCVVFGPAYIRKKVGTDRVTLRQAYEALLQWCLSDDELGARCFSYHRSPELPLRCRRHGLALPGYQSPAAGWLLPVVGRVETSMNIVTEATVNYTAPGFLCRAGLSLPFRRFPYFYGSGATGIFVETGDGDEPVYLQPAS